MDEQIAFTYLADKNRDGRTVSGTPLRDLSAADIAGYPAWQVREIAACGFYQAVEKRPSASKQKESAPAASTATEGRRSATATGGNKDSKSKGG